MCVPKSNSNDRYAITCDVIAYHLVHFVSIRLINKCQSGIDFIFTSERAIYSSFMKISVPSPVFTKMKVKLCKLYTRSNHANVNKGMRFASGVGYFDTLERQMMGVYKYASTFPMASRNKKMCNHGKNVA